MTKLEKLYSIIENSRDVGVKLPKGENYWLLRISAKMLSKIYWSLSLLLGFNSLVGSSPGLDFKYSITVSVPMLSIVIALFTLIPIML